MTRRFIFLLASGRPNGNTEILARRAAARLPSNVAAHWLDLAALTPPPFVDVRDAPRSQLPDGERTLLDATLAATDLVIVSPTYWGGLSASAKLYLDYTVSWRKSPGLDFARLIRNKTLWGVTTLSGAASDADPLVAMLRDFADYFELRMGGMLIGIGNKPGDVRLDTAALAHAETFFA